MGATIPIVTAIIGAGATVYSASQARKAQPNISIEPPPAPTEATPNATPNQADAAAALARKKVSGAQGIQDTILTSPVGLGAIGSANTNKKTLLGY